MEFRRTAAPPGKKLVPFFSHCRYGLKLETSKAKETKAALEKRKEARVDESKFRYMPRNMQISFRI